MQGFEQNYEISWKMQKFGHFYKTPLDKKGFILCESEFVEMVCFIYRCFENSKIEIQFYTVLSDLQNPVIEIPIKNKHKKYIFFTGDNRHKPQNSHSF